MNSTADWLAVLMDNYKVYIIYLLIIIIIYIFLVCIYDRFLSTMGSWISL